MPSELLDQPTLHVPIRVGPSEAGMLLLGRGTDFDEEERELVQLFASQFGVFVRNELVRGQMRDSVQRADAERRRLSMIISSLPDAIVHVDAATGAVDANETARQMFGWAPACEPDNVWVFESRCCTEDGRPLPHSDVPISRALRGERFSGEELFIMQSNGSLLPVLCSAAPLVDETGTIRSAVAEFQDMSHVREAQERIAELSAERGELLNAIARQLQSLRVLLDSAPVGMMMVQGHDARTVVFNAEMSKLAGMEGGDEPHMANYISEFVIRKPDGRACEFDERPLIRALRTGETVRAEEMSLQRKDGTLVPVLLHAAPIRGTQEEVIGAVGVAEDRTHLVEMQRQRNDFVAVLSHEMKNPLTILKGVASAVRRQRKVLPEEEVSELLELLEQQADRLTDLLDNLTNVTRLETGTFSIQRAPVCVKKLIDEACRQFDTGISTHEVRWEIEGDLPAVQADEPRIAQVLLNLLNNAAKFSEPGSVIAVKVVRDADGIKVSVRDQGPGISEEDMPRLFQKFTRLHKQSKPGSGLGLVICKGIVEAHGGAIWAESDGPGEGATFSFSLPL